jgi:Ni/Fe-hydrogenase subunit HybB-like protein
LFFGGAESPVVTASTLGNATNVPLFFGGTLRTTDAAFYSPSAIEWLSSIGIIALAVIGFSLGWLLLPLQDEPEAVEPGPRYQPIAEVVTWK